MLTTALVKAARPRACAYKLWDGGGLHLHVAPTGHRAWRVRRRRGGRETLVTIGTFPDIGLAEARAIAEGDVDAARDRGAAGTFEQAARSWLRLKAPAWTATHAADVATSLERDAFPAIGARALATIRPPEILELLRAVEARGSVETARRLRQRVSAVFELAIGEGWCAADPAEKVGRGLRRPAPARPQPAIVKVAEARALLAAVDALDAAASAKRASLFLALTAVRWAAVRGARWDEIEDLDGAAPAWRVPAARMKLAAAKKGDAAHDHVVPLSAAAVAVLRTSIANLHGGDANMHGLIFPGRGGRPLGEAAIATLYGRTRFAGRHVPHGWRSTFSTVMNEAFPGDRFAIDRALAHAPKDKVEAAYNRSEQLLARRRLFDAWGTMLSL